LLSQAVTEPESGPEGVEALRCVWLGFEEMFWGVINLKVHIKCLNKCNLISETERWFYLNWGRSLGFCTVLYPLVEHKEIRKTRKSLSSQCTGESYVRDSVKGHPLLLWKRLFLWMGWSLLRLETPLSWEHYHCAVNIRWGAVGSRSTEMSGRAWQVSQLAELLPLPGNTVCQMDMCVVKNVWTKNQI
jgi:hypothetical protein